MKNLLVLVFFGFIFCYGQGLKAQSGPGEVKTFYYLDGSIYRGTVLREGVNRIVLIVTTGDTVHLDKNLISLLQKKIRGNKFHFHKGFFGTFNIGISTGEQLNFMVGYRLNEKYSFGIGTGIHTNYRQINGLYVDNILYPVYAHARRYFGRADRTRPYLFLNAGYSFAGNSQLLFNNNHQYSGGPLIEPGIGIQFAARKKWRFSMSLSQLFQYSEGSAREVDFLSNPVSIDYSLWYSQTVFKVGINFR